MVLLILFLFGLCIGSFLNVLIDRLPKEQSVVYPPSRCDHCKKRLAWYDLLPVFSFLLLRGRCRYCKKPIGWQYPLVEILTGMLFIFTWLHMSSISSMYQVSSIKYVFTLLFFLFIISSFIVVFFVDLKYGIIPDKVILPTAIVSFVYILLNTKDLLLNNILAGVGAFLFFLAIYLLTRGKGMGFGDVKLSFLLGLVFGFPAIVFVLYLAFLTGGIFSIILLILRRKKLKGTIAFGPFLVVASLLVFFFEKQIASVIWFLPAVLA